MEANNPLVSILINNYNYGRFLGEAILSCINQSYNNCEIIVVDDGSEDNSKEVIDSFSEKVVPIFKENGGQASAFNAAYLLSKGEIIFFLDADDVFYFNKVQEIVNMFIENKNCQWINHELDYDNRNYCHLEGVARHISSGDSSYKAPATSGLAYRREFLSRILPMPEGKDISIGDHYIKFAAVQMSNGMHLTKPLAYQRIHDGNYYTGSEKAKNRKHIIGIRTSYHLKDRYKSMSRFADRYFSQSIADSLTNMGVSGTFEVKEAALYIKKYSSIYLWCLIAAKFLKRFVKKSINLLIRHNKI